jgi:AraC family transcriptional regulator
MHDFVRSDGETTINGGNRSTLTDARDRLTFVPIGSSVEGWTRFKSRVSAVFAVHLGSPISGCDASDISEAPPSLYFENEKLKVTLRKLQSVVDGSGMNDSGYVETLGLLLLWELRHFAELKRSKRDQVRGGLTALQLRRVKEFIDTRISTEITISDLAAIAGLSHFHFIRAFKESVNVTPYQYVLLERISRARELLSESDMSIANVAFAVGFSDTSQLKRVFRKVVGVTPAVYRREMT